MKPNFDGPVGCLNIPRIAFDNLILLAPGHGVGGCDRAYLISTTSVSEVEAQVACIASDDTNGQYRT